MEDENSETAAPKFVWVFRGDRAPSRGGGPCTRDGGVFRSVETATVWISRHRLTGRLTQYPLNIGVFDHAVENGWIVPSEDQRNSPEYVGTYCDHLQHMRFEDGRRVG